MGGDGASPVQKTPAAKAHLVRSQKLFICSCLLASWLLLLRIACEAVAGAVEEVGFGLYQPLA